MAPCHDAKGCHEFWVHWQWVIIQAWTGWNVVLTIITTAIRMRITCLIPLFRILRIYATKIFRTHSSPSRRTICQFCRRITILWNCVLLILIILSTAPIFIVPSCCLKCYLSPKIFYSFFALEGRLIILLRIYSHTCYRSIYCSNFYWPCWSKYNSLSKIFYSLPSINNFIENIFSYLIILFITCWSKYNFLSKIFFSLPSKDN